MNSIAVDCALAGVRAVDPCTITRAALEQDARVRELMRAASSISVVAIGKAAVAMAQGAIEVLDDRIARGVMVAPNLDDAWKDARLAAFVGGHPIPSVAGERGARAIRDLADEASAGDVVLCLISGGASALTMLPADAIALPDLQVMTSQLLRAGATIAELNCVRKHVDQLKGGRLARLAAPATVVTLVLSDVIGDPVDVIASGPTVPDPTTIDDAIAILRQRGVWDDVSTSIRAHLLHGNDESPKPGDTAFANTHTVVVGNNRVAAEAARTHAESVGYVASVETLSLSGEARDVGTELAQHAVSLHTVGSGVRRCLIYAGETTVTVTGHGVGGRNQEVALGAAIALDGHTGIVLASVGTDGIDGPTDAAGAVATGETLTRARTIGLDANRALATNDAYPFWRALDDLVVTGPTGTNVMDLVVVTLN